MCQGGFGDIAPFVAVLLAAAVAGFAWCVWGLFRGPASKGQRATLVAGGAVLGPAAAYLAIVLVNGLSNPGCM